MTHRDRATGTAVSQGFRTASRLACDAGASPHHALLAENLGKPSLWVITKGLWYERAGAGVVMARMDAEDEHS